MWRIRWEQVERILMDWNINERMRRCARIDRLQEHAAFMLVEKLRGRVDVVVGSGVRATDDHDCQT